MIVDIGFCKSKPTRIHNCCRFLAGWSQPQDLVVDIGFRRFKVTSFINQGKPATRHDQDHLVPWSKHERTSIIGHCTDHGGWSSREASSLGIERGIIGVDTWGSEVSTIDENVAGTSPVPWLPISYTLGSIVLQALCHLLEGSSSWCNVVVSLAVDGWILTSTDCISPPWVVVIVHHMEIPKSTSASPMHPIDRKLNTSEAIANTTHQKNHCKAPHNRSNCKAPYIRRHKVARYPQRRRSKNRQKPNSKRKYKFKDTQ